ncbi:MAG TPA: hypothetical protein DD413_09225 [Ruminococcus sp.]|nr:hypothetical protein [Ruminococcus sp.]
MKAIKGNKAYTVNTTEEAKVYKAQGFDIYDDNGKIKEHAIGKTVPLESYEALAKENEKLKAENKKLKSDQKE